MNTLFRCKRLICTYKLNKGVLGNNKDSGFTILGTNPITVKITQSVIRTIEITSQEEADAVTLYGVLTQVERLLMMFDGYFLSLETLTFCDSNSTTNERLQSYALHCKNNRLNYFNSSSICLCPKNKLLNYTDVLTYDLYKCWENILCDLGIVHQMFLYSLSTKQPIDISSAFMIQLAEPLVELVKQYTSLFPNLTPGTKETTLRDCLKELIYKYGKRIFKHEIKTNRNQFLTHLVNSRVRIMHIKKKQQTKYLLKGENQIYIIKMYLLYRVVVFDLLKIDKSKYFDSLGSCLKYWNQWNDIVPNFLFKLKKNVRRMQK